MKPLEISDIFCGAGGTSTGAIEAAAACGYQSRLTAINHWPIAIETHTLNRTSRASWTSSAKPAASSAMKTFTARTRAKEAHGTAGYDLRPAHPTQKPVELMAWSMERAKVPAGALVCDPYFGSGSTAIACLRSGRRFVGAEKDPVHFAAAVARIQRELSQGVLSLGGGGAELAGDSAATQHSGAGSQNGPDQLSGDSNQKTL